MEEIQFEEKVEHYVRLESANYKALSALTNLRQAFEKKDFAGIICKYTELMREIQVMGECYSLIEQPRAFIHFYHTFKKIDDTLGERIESAAESIALRQRRTYYELLNQIDELNISGENPLLPQCRTPHDIIRCLHAISLNSLLSGVGLKTKPEIIEYEKRGVLNVLSQDNGENADLVRLIDSFFRHNIPKKGTEEYRVFSIPGFFAARIRLGCHFSTMDIKTDGENSLLNLKFTNTSAKQYQNAPERTKYITRILTQMNFAEINTVERFINARKNHSKRKELRRDFFGLVRLLASTKDLDCNPRIEGRVDEAVAAFMNGTTDICSYLELSAQNKK